MREQFSSQDMDKTRASRDGHEFHEAWAARKALQLIMPNDGLVGIAIEGPAPEDQHDASDETVEIADLTFYFGQQPAFPTSTAVVIVQLKYSKSAESVPFRVSHAKKTITKFAVAFDDYARRFGEHAVNAKLSFELVSNRPIADDFISALAGLAAGRAMTGEVKEQSDQFISACGFSDVKLQLFAEKVRLTGLTGNLRENKQQLSMAVADWSVAPDAMARARLGRLQALLRDKAGLAGEGRNVITRIAVLDALEVSDPDELFPCPVSFPQIGQVVPREQLPVVAACIPTLVQPLLLHAEGGSGKTVFMQSLSSILAKTHKTILFDCFGGGDYRAPDDGRHLPKRGLIHIVNLLACDGLCDPLLPNHEQVEDLFRAFRLRLSQAVATLRRTGQSDGIVLFIDAIDNAAEHAADRHELAFPTLLLESLHIKGPISGVRLVVSCRTYRRDISRRNVPCLEVELTSFSLSEAQLYLSNRLPDVNNDQIAVAHARSRGNPRILEHLALSDRGLLDPSEVNNVIALDALIQERIDKALSDANSRGYKPEAINAFLAGLAVLPPPIPLEEYASAHDMDASAIASFAADLAPLLERSRYGMMFRDEPTETFIRNAYGTQLQTLRILATNMLKRQDTSVYAASALPGLLQKLQDGAMLFDLAFDTRFPAAIKSTLGRSHIRYHRLKAAVLHATKSVDFNRLVHLMLELSTLAATNQRGREYLLANPDLATILQDVDAIRRLFDIQTHWPGTRHSRLAISSTLSGDLSEAYRHVVSVQEWSRHFFDQDEEYQRDRRGPDKIANAAVPLYFIAKGDTAQAMRQLRQWYDWYAFGMASKLFEFLQEAIQIGTIPIQHLECLLDAIAESKVGLVAAAVCTLDLSDGRREKLVRGLAQALKQKGSLEVPQFYEQRDGAGLRMGLLQCAGVATNLGQREDAAAILASLALPAPKIWVFTQSHSVDDAIEFMISVGIKSALMNSEVSANQLLPHELLNISESVKPDLRGDEYKKVLKAAIDAHYALNADTPGKSRASQEEKSTAIRFVEKMLEPARTLTCSFARVLAAPLSALTATSADFVKAWRKCASSSKYHYSDQHHRSQFFSFIGREMTVFLFATRTDITEEAALYYIDALRDVGQLHAGFFIRVVSIFAKRPLLHELAGRTAAETRILIERDDDVSLRAADFARLSRAIYPASSDEAATYFRLGIDQMDAIGSGDYQFTNELLMFAAQLREEELDAAAFHTLSNLCELNMYEERKFPWLLYAQALTSTSGRKTLARLARWHDRDKVSLSYTLLPYLTLLIEQSKMDPRVALALLRTTDPAELYVCDTSSLADVIIKKSPEQAALLLSELIWQYFENNLTSATSSILTRLKELAETVLMPDSEIGTYLINAVPIYKTLSSQHTAQQETADRIQISPGEDAERAAREAEYQILIERLVADVNYLDVTSMSLALDKLNTFGRLGDKKNLFFSGVRQKIKFGERAAYIRTISSLEQLEIYPLLKELELCHARWLTSSPSLKLVFEEIAIPLVQGHANSLISFDTLSGSVLSRIAEISATPVHLLVLAMIELFASRDWHLAASTWLALAAGICECSDTGQGQAALTRLLSGGAAKLAATVADGDWTPLMYPGDSETELAAGFIWFCLGASDAASRWRAAHAIRRLAKFEQWAIVDAIIARIDRQDAEPFQAPELRFFHLHAKLWLLISLARLAIDYPAQVARHADALRGIVTNLAFPHILMRQFAADTLLTCAGAGALHVSAAEQTMLQNVNASPFPAQRTDRYPSDSFYQSRPEAISEPEPPFHVDYDFGKTTMMSVSNIFDRNRWEIQDAITAWVRKFDQCITGMSDSDGRSISQRGRFEGMQSKNHTYGQYLGCHALMLVAGDLLNKYPVLQRPYGDDDEWTRWLSRQLLTREDGYWLSDGVVLTPLDTLIQLRERGPVTDELTSNPAIILKLLNITTAVGPELVVSGDWQSQDGIDIHIASALAPRAIAKKSAIKLAKLGGFQVWLPKRERYGDVEESSMENTMHYDDWLSEANNEKYLDGSDPMATDAVTQRTLFSKETLDFLEMHSSDPFKQIWNTENGEMIALSQVWGRNAIDENDSASSGERLTLRTQELTKLLKYNNSELIILVRLRRYERGYGSESGQYWHTVGVVQVDQDMDFTFHPGVTNYKESTDF